MKCKKRRYRDQVDAKIALANIQWRDNARRQKTETRLYRCPHCKGYHLTSKK